MPTMPLRPLLRGDSNNPYLGSLIYRFSNHMHVYTAADFVDKRGR